MTESEDEDQMVYHAMINSYNVIIDHHLDDTLVGLDKGWFVHDIREPVEKEVLENMLDFFTEIEHYEKCAKISAILDSWTENKYRKI